MDERLAVASTFLRRNRLFDFQPYSKPTVSKTSASAFYRRKRRSKSTLLRQFKFQKSGGWLLGLLAASGLFLWDQKLMLSTVSGLAMMALIYAMQQSNWRQRWLPFYKLITNFSTLYVNAPSRQVILAVGGGIIAILSTYLAVSIWNDASSPWMAAGAILQGGGTLAVLLMLTGQWLQRQTDRKDVAFTHYLADLTHADPLKRLVAVKQLTRSLNRPALDAADRAAIADCFRMMVGQEQEPLVQDAIFDGLQACDRQLEPVHQPQPLPPLARKSAGKLSR